jgi:hypothetical protein
VPHYTRRVPETTRVDPRLILAVAAISALVSMAMCATAVLAHAPPIAVPLVVAICVGCPLFAGWEVPGALVTLRAERIERFERRALAALRKSLAQLPETEHPLGL